jgi:hypothetical protein
LPFATHQEFAGPPVDIIKLYGDDLRCTQPEACHQQNHRVVALSMFRTGVHGGQNLL